tara:strand:- start:1273 stop:1500 length:228 start_codon:yes stop_codon:yes gene_type:complete
MSTPFTFKNSEMKNNKTENQLRKEVLGFMADNNLSANFIGKKVDCHPQTITNWVNGEKSMRINTLESIHKFMHKF